MSPMPQPRGGVRTCCMCRTTGSNHSVVQEPLRNYYYCSGCAPAHTFTCSGCNSVQRRNLAAYVSSATPHSNMMLMCRPCVGRLPACNSCHRVHHDHRTEHVNGVCSTCRANNSACSSCNRSWDARQHDPQQRRPITVPCCSRCLPPLELPYSNPFTTTAGFEAELMLPPGYSAPLVSFGSFKDDGSLYLVPEDDEDVRNELRGWRGREFVSEPRAGAALLSSVHHIMGVLREAGARATYRCSTHVHIDVRGFGMHGRRNIRWWWTAYDQLFRYMCRPTRYDNQYCARPATTQLVAGSAGHAEQAAWENAHQGRYFALNAQAYSDHGTYEIRLLHGTTDPDELCCWMLLLLHFFHTYSALDPEQHNFPVMNFRQDLISRFAKQAALPTVLVRFMLRRLRENAGYHALLDKKAGNYGEPAMPIYKLQPVMPSPSAAAVTANNPRDTPAMREWARHHNISRTQYDAIMATLRPYGNTPTT